MRKQKSLSTIEIIALAAIAFGLLSLMALTVIGVMERAEEVRSGESRS